MSKFATWYKNKNASRGYVSGAFSTVIDKFLDYLRRDNDFVIIKVGSTVFSLDQKQQKLLATIRFYFPKDARKKVFVDVSMHPAEFILPYLFVPFSDVPKDTRAIDIFDLRTKEHTHFDL